MKKPGTKLCRHIEANNREITRRARYFNGEREGNVEQMNKECRISKCLGSRDFMIAVIAVNDGEEL
jgi:hypothetical protein